MNESFPSIYCSILIVWNVFQASQVTDLEEERNKLKEQLAEMSQKIESLEGTYNKFRFHGINLFRVYNLYKYHVAL